MKKNLLVTLGCSFTEGVGCYDMENNPTDKVFWEMDAAEAAPHIEHFHKYGWPNLVGGQLGFDNVLNLGFGGSANSEHVKKFVQRVVGRYEEFNIYVIWLMTDPIRISFYDGNSITSANPNGTHYQNLFKGYIKDINDVELGCINEQVFYIKTMEQICQNNGYKLIWESWHYEKNRLLPVYNSVYNLFDGPSIFERANISDTDNPEIGAHDKHLNKYGYQVLANKFVEDIKLNKPEFVVGPVNNKVKWQWKGNTKLLWI